MGGEPAVVVLAGIEDDDGAATEVQQETASTRRDLLPQQQVSYAV